MIRRPLLAVLSVVAVTCAESVSPESPMGPNGGDLGAIIVDPDNPSWLIYEHGDPFFMAGPGDPEGFLYRGSLNADGTRNGDHRDLISKLAGTGANSIYLMAVRSHGGDGGGQENPFINGNPANGLDQDKLEQWETWFAEMDQNGIVIFFIFYDDSADPWGGNSMGAAEQQFVADLVNRFKHHDHLIWCVAEEYGERLSTTRASQIAAEIAANDERGHSIAVHQNVGTTFDFPNNPNVDQFAMQLSTGSSLSAVGIHSAVVTAWGKSNGRYNLNMAEGQPNHGSGSAQRTRRVNWAAVMGGAYVMVLRWDIANTSLTELEQAGHIVNFMEATRVNRMAPDDARAFGSTDWVLVEAPSESFVAYSANASGPMGVTNIEAGNYDLTWLDTITGDTVQQSGLTVGAGDNAFALPTGITGSEVAVYIRKTGL